GGKSPDVSRATGGRDARRCVRSWGAELPGPQRPARRVVPAQEGVPGSRIALSRECSRDKTAHVDGSILDVQRAHDGGGIIASGSELPGPNLLSTGVVSLEEHIGAAGRILPRKCAAHQAGGVDFLIFYRNRTGCVKAGSAE